MRKITGGKLKYEVFGPFSFKPQDFSTHKEALQQFWAARAEDSREGLNKAVGVYVWTCKNNGRRIPWNVGLTSKQGFQKRFEQKAIGFPFGVDTPEVYLLALETPHGGFRKPTSSGKLPANNWLEEMLIGSAIRVNPDLRNTSASKYLRNTVVQGYLNDDEKERTSAARSFNKVFLPLTSKKN